MTVTRNLTTSLRLAAPLLFAAIVGCASNESSQSSTRDTRPIAATQASAQASHGECTVCKHNADLACIDVDVDKSTPRTSYKGKTYYFCSDECKREFQKDPAKYSKYAAK